MTNEIGVMVGDDNDDGKPDPEAFKVHMRTVHAGDDTAMRHDDFVGSYNHTGRVKLDKKKWTPQKPEAGDNAFRADDWMGSGKTQRKTWQVKSTTNVVKTENADNKPEDFVTSGTSPTRKWKPPPKDHAIPPPWLSSPTTGSTSTGTKSQSPRKSWQPSTSPAPAPAPVDAIDHTTKDMSVQGEMSLSDLHSTSNHSHVKDAVERLSGSMTHMSLASTKHPDHIKAWQSHSALDHHARSHDSHSDRHDESSNGAYEVESDDEQVKHEVPKVTEHTPAPPVSSPAVGYVVSDDDGKPNPEEYKIHMRTVHAGEDTAMRHDDFVGSYNNTGRLKLEKKKWTPAKKPEVGDNAFRSDDWMGSGKTQRKSWQVKSPTKVGKPVVDDKPGEFVSPTSPNAHKWKPPPKDHAISPPWMSNADEVKEKVSLPHPVSPIKHEHKHEPTHQEPVKQTPKSPPPALEKPIVQEPQQSQPSPPKQEHTAAPSPPVESNAVPAIGFVVGGDDDDGRPNPEEYKIHMRTVHAGEDSAMRHDDFVGSYSNTGRLKLEKKKWAPAKKPDVGDNAFRSDDWMGSGAPQKKSWKPKS